MMFIVGDVEVHEAGGPCCPVPNLGSRSSHACGPATAATPLRRGIGQSGRVRRRPTSCAPDGLHTSLPSRARLGHLSRGPTYDGPASLLTLSLLPPRAAAILRMAAPAAAGQARAGSAPGGGGRLLCAVRPRSGDRPRPQRRASASSKQARSGVCSRITTSPRPSAAAHGHQDGTSPRPRRVLSAGRASDADTAAGSNHEFAGAAAAHPSCLSHRSHPEAVSASRPPPRAFRDQR